MVSQASESLIATVSSAGRRSWPTDGRGYGKTHPIKFYIQDSQSDTNRAAQVAGDLIMNEGIRHHDGRLHPGPVSPVADQCEAMEHPLLQQRRTLAGLFLRSRRGCRHSLQWTYHHFWGVEDLIGVYLPYGRSQVPTRWSERCGPTTPTVMPLRCHLGIPACHGSGRFSLVDPGRYPKRHRDFTAQISQFKNEGVEIITGVPIPPDFNELLETGHAAGFLP